MRQCSSRIARSMKRTDPKAWTFCARSSRMCRQGFPCCSMRSAATSPIHRARMRAPCSTSSARTRSPRILILGAMGLRHSSSDPSVACSCCAKRLTLTPLNFNLCPSMFRNPQFVIRNCLKSSRNIRKRGARTATWGSSSARPIPLRCGVCANLRPLPGYSSLALARKAATCKRPSRQACAPTV